MLEHDAIYHYGIPGMRWGRRKAANISRSLAKNKRKDQQGSRRIAGWFETDSTYSANKARSSKNPVVKSIHVLNSKYSKAQANQWNREANRDRAAAERHQRRAEKLEASLRQPLKTSNNKRNERIFEKAVGTLIIGTAGALTVAVLRPTANAFGEQLASYVTRKVANRSGDIFNYTMKL